MQDNRILHRECRALAQAGFDITLAAVADSAEPIGGVKIHPLPRHSGRARRMARGPFDAYRSLAALRPEVVHGHDPELIPVLVAWKLRHPRTTVIFDAHEDLPKQVAGKTYIPRRIRPLAAAGARGVELLADRFLDHIVVATPSIRRNFTSSKTILVQNFPWLADFPAPQPAAVTERPRLCYIGSISPERGVAAMVDAVNHSEPAAELVIAGKATDRAKAMLDEAGPRTSYLGALPPGEMPALLASCSVGLALLDPLPNYLESQATKIFEYMAAARPFVASNFPAWREMFEEIGCGFLVDPHDKDAVRHAVDTLLQNPALAMEMGLRGRRALEAGFTFDGEAARLTTTLQKDRRRVAV
ncbi:glycosyltransferase family 4 protein [Allobranchiibius sp. GilTou38]|uniref:glycosyltransferase n=1 Tax=Allobranchiibius sp. GilTou38 TaxID=2815210 RepID=UPI001AA0FD2D|nr:glycosyltransferase family 4 protein [Allobranchiibius sp. GilTou38]